MSRSQDRNSPESPLVMLILDGIGLTECREDNAVCAAGETIVHNPSDVAADATLYVGKLKAHGRAVGLPSDSDMGNSEVGHNILGAGRVFPQGATQVESAIATGAIWGRRWLELLELCSLGNTLHLVGLLSDGNIHSHVRHLEALVSRAVSDGLQDVAIHVLFDGRDVPDYTAHEYVENLEVQISRLNKEFNSHVRIASGGGRMSTTMDRYGADWSVVQRGYQAHVLGRARGFSSAIRAISEMRSESPGVSDQYLPEFVVVDSTGRPVGPMRPNDVVLLFNFRGDRMIEFYEALTRVEFEHFDRETSPSSLNVFGMTLYDGDKQIPGRYLVDPQQVAHTVSEIVAEAGLRQCAIAETQKFGHITYFWNGNRSEKFSESSETYVEIPSKSLSFELQPEMRTRETSESIVQAINSLKFDFIRANFAAGDMIGHTGNLDAAIEAVLVIDEAVRMVIEAARHRRGTVIITADHGNCEIMYLRDSHGSVIRDDQGRPVPLKSHTLSPVPFIMIDFKMRTLKPEVSSEVGLSNVAAVILNCLGLPVPHEYHNPVVRVGGQT